ncbi:Pleiotropic drug resistance protein [Vigna angularis]|uniref:Pleiotropic drug resistance protein n=1 Tax=Phaseolus angularis TaxID=3914 RepID=A0A8T0KTQ4_PHAAN|nr:Pleiotropic drug resistance protein [Vigna angularis]
MTIEEEGGVGGDGVRSRNEGRRSCSSSASRDLASARFDEAVSRESDVFHRGVREIEEEEELKWEALKRLPTYDRMRRVILKQVLDNGGVNYEEVDITKLGVQEKKHLLENIVGTAEENNESFLHRMRDRIDRVSIEIPQIEVRYENLSVEGDAYVGRRALPTLFNSTINAIEVLVNYLVSLLFGVLGFLKLLPQNTRVVKILQEKVVNILKDISGIVKPSRMTLLLGPPGSGKTTFLKALAGKMDKDLRVSGRVTYCGHELSEFVPERTCAYISQHDLHYGEMTVRETLDFSGRCLGVGTRYDMLEELSRREIAAGIKPDPEIDAFMKATAMEGQETSLVTDYVLKPAPETYELFDDIILLSEGEIVYQGPRESVLHFFESVGFKCPERKGVADFLQEVTSKKDQEQYWFRRDIPYQYVTVPEFVAHFKNYSIGQQLHEKIKVPYDPNESHRAALVKEKYGISKWELFKACFSREWLLMKRNYFLYIFKTFQITIMALIAMSVFFRTEMKHGQLEGAGKYYGALFFSLINIMFNGVAELSMTVIKLPIFYKQRDFHFFPAWAFALPIWVLRVPLSLLESGLWVILTYYTIGFAPAAKDIGPWMIWCYYSSPMMYGQNAIAINEFLDKRWSAKNIDPRIPEPTVGKAFLNARGIFTEDYWYWISVAALIGFSLLFNIFFILALTYLNPFGNSKAIIMEDEDQKKRTSASSSVENMATGTTEHSSASVGNSFEVYESLVFSAWLRLSNEVNKETRKMFIEEILELVELHSLRHFIVGLPGINGLSTEQRKRLTIAVELVANPSIIFMDEPTTGLDARAAAVVMRTVRNTVDTGRTVVCTIHQPSIDIFENFDELLLMKIGGQVIYGGPLGRNSQNLIEYFEGITGVPKIKDGYNPATWMLEITASVFESQLNVDFAELYAKSDLYQKNQELIQEICTPVPGTKDLYFPTKYSQSFVSQCKACFWKQNCSYWRNPEYNAIRLFVTIVIGIIFGLIYWDKGKKTEKEQDLLNLLGAMYASVFFLGASNTNSVQPVVAIERTVLYRERAAGMYSELPYAIGQYLLMASSSLISRKDSQSHRNEYEIVEQKDIGVS